ncbi:MAG: hypothetical protein E7390_06735 [Ruminococcaceae bacterium]|nr:hypothetical protein [Oscillospiraceae bacterium]
MVKYCVHCGSEVNEAAVVCVKCGCAIPRGPTQSSQEQYTPFAAASIVDTITQRIRTNGLIWVVIAGIQILIGISLNWILLIVGALNLISAVQDLNYSKEFSDNPVGIVAKMKPIEGAIIVLIYNLVIGGLIGVAGSIYYLVAVRGYVLENERVFLDIENQRRSV